MAHSTGYCETIQGTCRDKLAIAERFDEAQAALRANSELERLHKTFFGSLITCMQLPICENELANYRQVIAETEPLLVLNCNRVCLIAEAETARRLEMEMQGTQANRVALESRRG